MSDPTIYKAGETVSATLTLEPDHALPTRVLILLSIQPEHGAPQAPIDRIDTIRLKASLAPPSSDVSGADSVTLALAAVIPKHILGGQYKPTYACFFMPDGTEHPVDMVDPNGNFIRHIADDPPKSLEVPRIKDLS